MNSIGVDFKLKNVEISGKKIKMQIVKKLILLIKTNFLVGYCWTRKI
jgi:hypothetical protein